MRNKVVLLGSSGGGVANESINGDFVHEVERQLKETDGLELAAVQIVCTEDGTGLDLASDDTPAVLISSTNLAEGSVEKQHGRLEKVNELARQVDERIGALIDQDPSGFAGIFCVSIDPHGTNSTVCKVGIKHGLYFSVSGGSGTALLLGQGAKVTCNSGGSCFTTRFSRAVSFCSGLAKVYGIRYSPEKGIKMPTFPQVRSIVTSLHPAFLTMALLKPYSSPAMGVLPCLCCVAILHNRAWETCSVLAIMTGVVVGCACNFLYTSIIVGVVLVQLLPMVLVRLIQCQNLPVTACSILSVLISSLCGVCLAKLLDQLFSSFFFPWDKILYEQPVLAGCANVAMYYGSKHGYYHAIALPIIMIEMQHGDFSFVGSLDFLALCCIGGGVCSAIYLVTDSEETRQHAFRGLVANLLFGDFVEACYPYLKRYPLVDAAGYVAAFCCVWPFNGQKCMSSAYLPAPVSIITSTCPSEMLLAALLAFGIPFFATIFLKNFVLIYPSDWYGRQVC